MENTLAGMDPSARFPDGESFVSPTSFSNRPDTTPLIQAWNSIQSSARADVDMDHASPRRMSGTSPIPQSEGRSSSVHSLLSAPVPMSSQSGSLAPGAAKASSSGSLSALADAAMADATRTLPGAVQQLSSILDFPSSAQPIIEQIAKQSEKSDGLSSIATFLASQIRVNGSDNLDVKLQQALRELTQQFDSRGKLSQARGDNLPIRKPQVNGSPQTQAPGESSSSDEGGSISLDDLKKGLQTLASALKKSKWKLNNKAAQKKICPKCRKVLERTCDMNKHMKRHTRPYGCTFSKCAKEFGSKNDWKRHENSLHFQIELYRCPSPDDSATAHFGHCATVVYSRQEFEAHLRDKHACGGEQLAERVAEARIGRNNQFRFWCGFCRRIIALQEQGVQGWDERYNHIDGHFKRGERIDNWVDAEANKTKGEMLREGRGRRDNQSDEDDEDDGKDAAASPVSNFAARIPELVAQPSGSSGEQTRKRKPDAGAVQSGKAPKGREWVIFCVSLISLQCVDYP